MEVPFERLKALSVLTVNPKYVKASRITTEDSSSSLTCSAGTGFDSSRMDNGRTLNEHYSIQWFTSQNLRGAHWCYTSMERALIGIAPVRSEARGEDCSSTEAQNLTLDFPDVVL